MTPAEKKLLQDAVKRSAWDPAYFLRYFLPHWFPSEIPPLHLGIIALATKKVRFLNEYPEAHSFLLEHFRYQPDARDKEAQPLPVFVMGADGRIKLNAPREHLNEIIPRGFSKTTLLKGLTTYDVVTDDSVFVVFISATATHAETQVSDIKLELEANALLRAAYGDQTATKADPEKWTAHEIHLKTGAILMARGRGGQVRGITQKGRRPNKIYLDDIEDEESIATDAQRKKTMNWFYSSVVPAGQIMEGAEGEDWAQEPLQIVNLGTLLGAECLVLSLTSNDDFSTIRFGALLPNGEALWPYKLGVAGYNRKRSTYQRSGMLAQFTREYDSSIRVSDDTIFPSIFIYEPTTREAMATVALAVDPAISEKKTACDTALMVVGRRASDGAIWLLDEWGGVGKSPREIIDAVFEYHLKWRTDRNGIEAVQYQKALIFLMREEMARRQLFFHIEAILQGSDDSKFTRIQGLLSPRYTNGFLRHLRPLPRYEANIADWPNGKVDYADAASMALTLLGETSGLVAENAGVPAPPLPVLPAVPELNTQRGNWIIHGRTNDLLRSGRYG
jgi:hypothetical protein